MFTDYLFGTINDNLLTDTDIFPDLSSDQLSNAISYIKNHRVVNNSQESYVARYLFANTLKRLLEDPESDLSQRLESNPKLRETLKDAYIESINAINKYFGLRVIAEMPGPFIVPDISVFVGNKVKDIARGMYGVVYSTDKDYAVKQMIRGQLDSSTIREVAILRYLDHPNVISVTKMQMNPPKIAMPLAIESMKDADLSSLNMRKWIFYQLFRGIAYCHSKYVWHRDLKPDNVLLFRSDQDIIAKIADFGLSIPYAIPKDNSTRVGTPYWVAPEIWLEDKNYSSLIDVWSLGIMLLNAAGGTLYPGVRSESDVIIYIMKSLGVPSEEDWSGVTSLSGFHSDFAGVVKDTPDQWEEQITSTGQKYYYNRKSLLHSLKKPYVLILTELDPEEREVIEKTLTWPTMRYSALEILKLPYFDSVRSEVEQYIPARPVTIQSCAAVMLNDQEQPYLLDENPYVTYRGIVLDFVWGTIKALNYNSRSAYYAVVSLDLYASKMVIDLDEIELYSIAALIIAEELITDQRLATKTTTSYKDTLMRDVGGIDKIRRAKRNIFTQRDFKLVVPSCADFVYYYTTDEEYSIEQIDTILYYAFVLLLNYELVLEYTQAQIAQAAIEIVGLTPKCLRDHEAIYNQRIYDYLESFTPPNNLVDEHSKYKLETYHKL